MSKITPNNRTNAVTAAKAYEQDNGQKEGTLTSRIPETILAKDGKNHFHVLLVRKRNDQARQKYVVEGNVQTFSKGPAFEKMTKNFKTQGFAAMIILHDPTKDTGEETATVPLHETSAIDRQIEAEEKKAMEDRIAKRKADAKAKLQEDADKKAKADAEKAKQDQGKQDGTLEFDGTKVTEENIDDFAKDNKIDLSKAKTPEGKLAIVTEWIGKQTKK